MHKHEQSFTTSLKKWLAHNFNKTCFIEAKIALGTAPLNYKSGFKDHQIPCLMGIRAGSFGYKISDMDRTQKPFDLIHSHKALSFVAIHWIRPKNKVFYLIDPTVIQCKIDDGKKSLSEEEAASIAYLIGTLK
jgi:hypothetical protein